MNADLAFMAVSSPGTLPSATSRRAGPGFKFLMVIRERVLFCPAATRVFL
jgi:hypothetical protein